MTMLESPKMESLPGEMIAEIGRYLSVADLAACSATCRTWREKFNDDRIWRRRCTLRLAEYLENTDTTFQPGLKLTEHDSLSPLCEWRARLIRENHLWNNWRQGNFMFHHIACILGANTQTQFYDNDHLVMVILNEVTVWNIRTVPTWLMTNPCDLDTTLVIDYFEILSEDRILFVQLSKVSVFHMNVTSSHWPLIHTFYFDERCPSEEFSTGNINSPPPRGDGIVSVPESCFYTVTGDYFVGVAPDYARLLHIWNIKTGKKLKEVVCPVSNPNSYFTNLIHSHKPAPDVLLVVEEHAQDESILNVSMHFFVYNVSELKFRGFRETQAVTRISLFAFMIYEPYVFIKDYFNLNIYNYKTSTLVDVKPSVTNPVIFNNNVIYVTAGKFMEFNVSTGKTNQLSSFDACAMFYIACDRFITQPLSLNDFQVLEVGKRESKRELTMQPNNHYWLFKRVANTNSVYTKMLIVETKVEENTRNVYVLNFW
ncbi:hypothetical protein J6590_036548 [Homalodisca vitripennis]|nr:hypothetical protein J6590_036548 [Homalodisca vitripennis]